MANSEILIDITDPKAVKASEQLISPSLYREVLARAEALADVMVELNPQPEPPGIRVGFNPQPDPPGIIFEFNPQPDPPGRQVELNPQPLPPERFVIWNGIVAPDSDWFYRVDAGGETLGIKVADTFAVPAQHASLLTEEHHAHLSKHAKTVRSRKLAAGGGHIFIGIRIDPR